MRERGERGRMGDARQGGGFRDRKRARDSGRPEWKPKDFTGEGGRDEKRDKQGKLEWKPKGEFTPAPKRSDRGDRPAWQPKGSFDRPRPSRPRPRATGKLDWTPKSGHTGATPEGAREKRKWIPKEEYKKSQGVEARRDKNWRPGGEHKDPRQKYKDAKKAKWQRFKTNIRSRWEAKQGAPVSRKPRAGARPPKKRRDEE
jgi:hypothetical protein